MLNWIKKTIGMLLVVLPGFSFACDISSFDIDFQIKDHPMVKEPLQFTLNSREFCGQESKVYKVSDKGVLKGEYFDLIQKSFKNAEDFFLVTLRLNNYSLFYSIAGVSLNKEIESCNPRDIDNLKIIKRNLLTKDWVEDPYDFFITESICGGNFYITFVETINL